MRARSRSVPRRAHLTVMTVLALLGGLAVLAPPAAASHPRTMAVSIVSVDGVGDDLDGIGRSDADFYAGVEFNRGTVLSTTDDGNSFDTHVDDDPNVTPFWTIPGQIEPMSVNTVPTGWVTLSIWDHDDCDTPFCADTGAFESDDDRLDIKPGAGETVALDIDLDTGRWTGDLTWPTNCVTGDGGEAVKVCFDISIDSGLGDTDGDFLLDGWERNGFNANGDGTIDVDLPAMGAHPGRKDLFLEIDCLVDSTAATGHSHCPVQGAVTDVVQAFANAPVDNIDGSRGIQLHVDIGNLYGLGAGVGTPVPRTELPAGSVSGTFGNYGGGGNQINEAGNLIIDYDGATGRAGTNFFTLKNFNSARDLIYRYAIFGHQTNSRAAANDCTSGQAKGIPGVNFFVTLGGTRANGNACWGADANGFSVGSQSQQAGTLMHEFGHTIGLQHGGGDGGNNKPNYLSVMNYAVSTGPAQSNNTQFCLVPMVGGLPGGCDYSRIDLASLNEVNPPGLDECAGIGLGLGGFDWNGMSGLTGSTCAAPNTANVSANINGDYNDANGDNNRDPGEADILGALEGFEDWNRIFYGFRTIKNFQTAGVPVPDEPDPDAIAESRAVLAPLVRPDLTVDKTGPVHAVPGDTLTYTIKTSNGGSGPALATTLKDTLPDGAQTPFGLGTLVVGQEAIRSVTYTVPCTTADGTVLTNSATATATDLLSNPFSTSDSAQTTVQAPVLSVDKTATSSVNAGEAITYRVTYENTGSGTATDVVVTDTLPPGVYYSKALDTGAGPEPNTVVHNADGTTTLTWNVGSVAGHSGQLVIEYTARPTLLFLPGTTVNNDVDLSFTNANGCTYAPVSASRPTDITEVMPTGDPLSKGYWKNHPEQWTAELLARIQATDQRYDGADGTASDGELTTTEVAAVFAVEGTRPEVLRNQLLATYLNLASRRINASTAIESKTANQLELDNVRDAALFANSTLLQPTDPSTAGTYSAATRVLDEINNNRSEEY